MLARAVSPPPRSIRTLLWATASVVALLATEHATAQGRADCYAPTYSSGSSVAFIWSAGSGGSLSNSGSYYAICQLRAGPPPADPTNGPPFFDAPTAIDSVQIYKSRDPILDPDTSLGTNGFGLPINGTITIDVPQLVGIGVTSFAGSNIALQVPGLTRLGGFGASASTRDASTLSISGGGQLFATNAALGSINVDGAISAGALAPEIPGFLISTTVLDLPKDAGLTRTGDFHIGFAAGSTGTVTIEGPDLASRLFIPRRELEVSNQGKFLFVGGNGTGTLNIGDYATVKSGEATLGFKPNSNGTINVRAGGELKIDQGGTIITPPSLTVGGEGTGTLNIESGGL